MAVNRLTLTIGVTTLLVCASASAAKLYKWVDENGNVTYSQQKPPGKTAQPMELKGYNAPDAAAATEAAAATADRADTARKDREFAAGEADALKQREKRLKKNCEIARQNLRVLRNSARIQAKDAEGKPYFLDPAQIEARIAESQKQVEDFCG